VRGAGDEGDLAIQRVGVLRHGGYPCLMERFAIVAHPPTPPRPPR
jgi:hypothetical protein